MNRRDIGIISFLLGWGIFFLNSVASYFSWYTSVWWFDMLMHFSGGVFLGTAVLLFSHSRRVSFFGSEDSPAYTKMILVPLLGIIIWEVLEYSLSRYGGDPFYGLDSVSDACLGLAGVLVVLSLSVKVDRFRV